jgi:6-phosphogluconolactonase (cycloisomerase 2 family)
MTSKCTSDFQLSGAYRLLVAVFAIAVLTACHPGAGSLDGGCLVCGTPNQVNLEGTLSGLVGSGLQLQNNGAGGFQLNGAASNGTDVLFAAVPFRTAYSLTVQTQPTNPSQTCIVANGTGTTGTADVTNIAVTCTTNPPRFAYVVNRGSNNVSAYTLDAATGALASIAGSPFAAGNMPVAIAVDPTGNHAYVVNKTDSTVSAFLIDRSSGALTPVSGSPFASGSGPTSVAIDPTSSFVYVTNGAANTLSEYAITADTGVLTAVPGSPFPTGTSPSSVVVPPDENVVLVANQSDGTVSVFGPLGDAGLSPNIVPPLVTGTGPGSLAIDLFEHLYVANTTSNTLSVFGEIFTNEPNTSSGSYATGTTPSSVAVDLLHNFVYVANQGSKNISAFALDATTGALTVVAGSPFAAGTQPSSVAVDPTGMFTYVVNSGSDTVFVYSIDATSGALTPIAGSPFVTGTQPAAIAISD